MMLRMLIVGVCGAAIAAAATFFTMKAARHRIRQQALKEGYELGRRDADNWWLDAERQTEEERRKIWRESA